MEKINKILIFIIFFYLFTIINTNFVDISPTNTYYDIFYLNTNHSLNIFYSKMNNVSIFITGDGKHTNTSIKDIYNYKFTNMDTKMLQIDMIIENKNTRIISFYYSYTFDELPRYLKCITIVKNNSIYYNVTLKEEGIFGILNNVVTFISPMILSFLISFIIFCLVILFYIVKRKEIRYDMFR